MNDSQQIAGLSPEEKRRLLAQLLLEKANQSTTTFPLAYGQRALWFIHQLAPDSAAYHIAFTARVRSAVNIPALKRTFQHLVDRNPALRTTYQEREGELVQVVNAYQEAAFEQIDAASCSEDELYQMVVDAHKQPFDLAQGPVIRWQLFTQDETNHVLLITVHHIAFDGYSMFVLLNDLKLIYDAEVSGQPVPPPANQRPYTDFVTQQLNAMNSAEGERLKNYWLNQLPGELPILNLPTDHPRPPVQTYNGAAYEFVIDADETKRLRSFAASEGVTLYVVLLAAVQTLLHRHTGQDKLLIGTPTSNRDVTEFDKTVGYFVNPIVLYSNIEDDPAFRTYLGRMRKIVLDGIAHQAYPFVLLSEQLLTEKDPSRSPIFQVMFNLQSLQRIEATSPLFRRDNSNPNTLLFEIYLMQHEEGQFDLTLDVVEVGGTLLCAFKYNTDLFDAPTITRWAGHYQTLLKAALDNPDMHLSQLPVLPDAERQQLLVEWNDTAAEYPTQQAVHQMFEQQAEKTPDAPALIYQGQTISYRELNERANRLAHHLRKRGVAQESLVGIYLERSIEMVVAVMATLKAGGVYMPLDPNYPRERIAYMISDSQVSIIVTQQKHNQDLAGYELELVNLDGDGDSLTQESSQNLASLTTLNDAAYVIYTSGSTGAPKGVVGLQRGMVNRFNWMWQTYPFADGEVCCQKTTLNFADSVWEIFGPLLRGVPIVIVPDEDLKDISRLIALLSEHRVSRLVLVPSLLQAILDSGMDLRRALPDLNYWVTSGEAVSAETVRQFGDQMPGARLINLYGSSEVAADVTYYEIGTSVFAGNVPIGKPIFNSQIYILDGQLQIAPIGVVGEIYVGGDGLARGYLHRDELTAERFIPNPFSQQPGARMYKTGDLARYLPDGNIEYLGRNDSQVKIRGHRVETGEVEAALDQHPAVQTSVVVAREDTPGDKRLVAYLIANGAAPAVADLRGHLRDRLPDYMIPSQFVTLEAFPLTPNGKVDRKALPAPDGQERESVEEYIPPRTPIEESVAAVWSDVLRLERVSIHDNFFDLGGHSLTATQVVARLRSTFGIEVPIRMMLDYPTVADLSAVVERQLSGGQAARPMTAISRIAHTDRLPLSYSQQRLWLIEQLMDTGAAYNIPIVVRLRGALDHEALQAALSAIWERHDVLRSYFGHRGEDIEQRLRPPDAFAISYADIDTVAPAEQEAETEAWIREQTDRPFDLTTGPLFRAGLLRLSDEEHVLVVNMHHIVSDGWSLGVLVREVAELYRAFASGQPSPLAELPIQYSDFAAWQREHLTEAALEPTVAYWTQHLSGHLPVLSLPTDRPRPRAQTFAGATSTFHIPESIIKALKTVSRREQGTLFMTLLAAFNGLLARYSGQTDIIVGTPIANRKQTEVEGLIGFFVNMLALRTDLSGNPSFAQLVRRVREAALGAYAHQDMPLEQLIDKLEYERNPSFSPIFQVMFVLQNAPLTSILLPNLTIEPVDVRPLAAQYDLTLYLREVDGGMVAQLEYNTDLFDAERIERMQAHFVRLLESAAANPDRPVTDLDILTDAERQQLLVEWNDTAVEYPRDQVLHHDFERQAERTPDATAVVFEEQSLTYAELNRRANQLAHHLRGLGVGPDQKVGIYIERSLEMMVGLYAILKAGGAYVPLDPTYPADRIALMVEDSQATVLITQERLLSQLPPTEARVVCIDRDWEQVAQQPQNNPVSGVQPHHLAYTIYTSGSTGKPKGVMIEHRNVVNFFAGMDDRVPHEAGGVWLAATSISFDISVLELFWTLARGFKVVLYGDELKVVQERYSIPALIRQHGVTHFQCTPSRAEMLTVAPDSAAALSTVQTLLVGGEALPVALARKLVDLVRTDVLNMYGPTETTIWSSTYRVAAVNQSIPVGKPIANTSMYILDTAMQPVPVGLPGELYIGGEGVVRGYWNRPELTAERFILNPFSQGPGARLYKTGDLARYLPDGNIDFLGRNDFQVKIRGHRIELGEIESALDQHPAVQTSVVVAREDTPGDKRLVAYLIANGATPAVSDLRTHLRERLPDYMIPSQFVTLEAFPLTPNGKVDRKALPAPQQSRSEPVLVQGTPTTDMEKTLAGIWEDVLSIDNVGIFDNFFDLGGHSLQVMRVVTHLETATGVRLDPVRMRFETLGQLAAFCELAATQPQAVPVESGLPKKLLSSVKRFVRGKSGSG